MRLARGLRRNISAALLAAAATLWFATSGAAQSASSAEDLARGLSIQYADGRITTRVLRPSGNMWTPLFPLLPVADRPTGTEAPSALDVAHVVDGPDVIVTVSLRYGTPHERKVPVTKRRVTPDAPLQVDELTAFGVAPVTFAIVPIPVTLTHPPVVVSASGLLDVRVEPIAPDIPAYRLVIANDSRHPLVAVHFEAFEGEQRILTGRKRGERNKPLAPPKGTYVLELPMSNGVKAGATASEGWKLLDRVVVTSVLWEDGVVEGDPVPAAQEQAIYAGRAKQLERVLALLSRTRNGTPAGLRTEVAALRSEIETLGVESGAGMQQVKDALLTDLAAFERANRGGSQAFGEWLTKTIVDYQEWRARIVGPSR